MAELKTYCEGPACEKCSEILDRAKTTPFDKILDIITFGSFKFKRFHCWGCLDSKLMTKSSYSKKLKKA